MDFNIKLFVAAVILVIVLLYLFRGEKFYNRSNYPLGQYDPNMYASDMVNIV